MLILNERNPKLSLYYTGSKLLSFLLKNQIKQIHLSDLYDRFNQFNNSSFNQSSFKEISFNRFMLTLDWLFILGKIEQDDNGILQCI